MQAKVSIIMGSTSDLPVMEEAAKFLNEMEIPFELHEDKMFAGFGGEIAALIASEAFEYLDAPVKRVGATFTPVGFYRALENAILPDNGKIEKAVNELLAY